MAIDMTEHERWYLESRGFSEEEAEQELALYRKTSLYALCQLSVAMNEAWSVFLQSIGPLLMPWIWIGDKVHFWRTRG